MSYDRGGNRGGYQSRGNDRGGFRPRRPSFNNDRGSREMFKTTCSNCGKECEVPFRPTNGKPVYCSDCFEKMGGRNSNDRPQRIERTDYRAQSAPVQDFSELNAKLDKIISLLEPKAPKVKKVTAKK